MVSPQIPADKPDMILSLTIGWNFISIPFPLINGNDTAEIFRGINSNGHSVYRYDTVSGWVKVRNSDYLLPMEGFWIFSAAPAQTPLFFKEKLSITSSARNLQTGWNTIGISSYSPLTINKTFQSISDKWMFLIPFNSTTQVNSDPCINGWNGTFGEKYELEPGKGYWLYMKSPGTFVSSASSHDITFSGRVGYKVTEQGWTITLPGTITGVLSPDSGNLQIFSNDAVIKYSGKSYPISMDIDASVKN